MDARDEELCSDVERMENEGGPVITEEDFATMLEVDIALIDWINRQDARDIAPTEAGFQ